MIKKIVMLLLLAGFVAIATDALSQSPTAAPPAVSPPAGSPTAPSTGANKAFPAPGMTTSGPAISKSDVFVPPAKDAGKESGKNTSSTPEATPGKSSTTAKDLAPTKAATSGKDSAKDSTSTKTDAGSTKTVPTSSVAAGTTTRSRELVVERALITLINDNKVPATEAGMLMGPLPVEEGSSVQKDEQVAQIDNRSTLAKQKIAEGEYLAEKARSENEAEVEVARAAILVSKEEYDQSLRIRESTPQAVPMSQVRKDKFNYEKSLAQEKQALNEKHIAGLQANAKYAQFEAASIELDLRQIKAPFKGEVVEIMKKPGDWVTAGEPIMHIVGLDKVRVKGFVIVSGPDGALPGEVMGKKVKITVEGAGGKKSSVDGMIGFASPYIEGVGSTRQFRVWAEVDNERTTDPATGNVSWKLQPGTVATMTIDLSPPKPAPTTKSDGKTQTYKPVTGDEKAPGKKKERVY